MDTELPHMSSSGYICIDSKFYITKNQSNASALFVFSDKATSLKESINEWETDDQKTFIQNCEKALDELQVISMEIEKQGRTFALTLTPIAGTTLVISFVSTQHKNEKSVTEIAIEASNLGICEWNIITGHIQLSTLWKIHLGYTPDELTDDYSTFEQLLHPGDKDRISREIKLFFADNQRIFQSEFRLRHKNGNYLWFLSNAICIRNEQNQPERMISASRDISQEKKSDRELDMFKQAVMYSPFPCIITDHEGYITFFNTSFSKKTGWDADEIIGKKPNILKSGLHSPEFYSKIWQTITNGNIWQGELKNKRKNGRHFIEQATIIPLRNKQGIITHFVKIAEDITAFRKLETDLRNVRKTTETSNLYKSNFLSLMSHKIRTPINGIIGFSDLLQHAETDDQQKQRYLNIIQQNSFILMHLIDNMMDAARLDNDQLKIKKESCALSDILSELQQDVARLMEQRGKERVELRFTIPMEPHHNIIFTDPLRLKQVLYILFENALKQTDLGHIEIGYQLFSDRKLQFYVQDTGVGMSEEMQDSIISQIEDPKYKAGSTKNGIGLGLILCRGLVHLLGGQMGIKSKKGEGSIFYFTIPYDKIKIQSKQSIIQKAKKIHFDFSDYTILVAEDVAYNFEYLKNIFAETGAKLIWARDGIDVLNIFNSQKIDLILMDIQLPEINGYEATMQIRKTNKDIPIIAQTAYTQFEDHENCLETGCNAILIKPFKVQDVLLLASKYLKSKS